MGTGERLAGAMSADDLGWSESVTKPVEYAAAMSGATPIGSDLFRSRDGLDKQALRRAILLIAARAIKAGQKRKLPISRAMAGVLAAGALFERLAFHCRNCTGARVVVIDQLKIVCPTCGGVGIHHYGDKERARLCGVKPANWPQWESRYALVMQIAVSEDTAQMLAEGKLR